MRCGQMFFDRELAHLNIRAGQISILKVLSFQDGISQETISELLHLDKGTVAKSIKPLVNEAYIIRKKSSHDKRAYQIFLTGKGRKIIPAIDTILKKWTDQLTNEFSDDEAKAVESFLSRMAQSARTVVFSQ